MNSIKSMLTGIPKENFNSINILNEKYNNLEEKEQRKKYDDYLNIIKKCESKNQQTECKQEADEFRFGRKRTRKSKSKFKKTKSKLNKTKSKFRRSKKHKK